MFFVECPVLTSALGVPPTTIFCSGYGAAQYNPSLLPLSAALSASAVGACIEIVLLTKSLLQFVGGDNLLL